MNALWRKIFSKREVIVVRKSKDDKRKQYNSGWCCSGCFRNFRRQCNAALHLSQSQDCRYLRGMVYPVGTDRKPDGDDFFEGANGEEAKKSDYSDLQPVYPHFLELQAERSAQELVEECFNDTDRIVRSNRGRKGIRNWAPGFIVRVHN